MAEINIKRKSSNAVWWIIAIIAILVIAWMAMGRGMGAGAQTTAAQTIGWPLATGIVDVTAVS